METKNGQEMTQDTICYSGLEKAPAPLSPTPYRAGWLIHNIRMEFLGRQARRSDPPHGVFYGQPGVDRPLPYATVQGIPANFDRSSLLRVLEPQVLAAIVGYSWVSGATPGYRYGDQERPRDDTRHNLLLWFREGAGTIESNTLPSTQTLIDLGQSIYCPARMEIYPDLNSLTKLRARTTVSPVAPIQVQRLGDSSSGGTQPSTGGSTAWPRSSNPGSAGRFTGPTQRSSGGNLSSTTYDQDYPPFHPETPLQQGNILGGVGGGSMGYGPQEYFQRAAQMQMEPDPLLASARGGGSTRVQGERLRRCILRSTRRQTLMNSCCKW